MEPVGLAQFVEVLAAVHVLVGVLRRAVDVGADVGALAPRLRVHVVRLVVLEAGVHTGRLVEQPGVEEPLAGGRRLGRDAEGDLLRDVALAVAIQLRAPVGRGPERRGKRFAKSKLLFEIQIQGDSTSLRLHYNGIGFRVAPTRGGKWYEFEVYRRNKHAGHFPLKLDLSNSKLTVNKR